MNTHENKNNTSRKQAAAFDEALSGFQTLMKASRISQVKTLNKIKQLDDDVVSIMERQLDLDQNLSEIRKELGMKPRKFKKLSLLNRILFKFGAIQYSKKELTANQEILKKGEQL